MDDILVIRRDQVEHEQRLTQIRDKLVERKLALNLEKCLFSQTRLQYLNAVLVTLPALDQRLDEIRSELKNDDTLKTVMQYSIFRMGGLIETKSPWANS